MTIAEAEVEVRVVDVLDPDLHNGPSAPEVFRWLRDEAPVYRDEPNAIWALSRHEDVRFAEVHPDLFTSDGGSRPGMTFGRRTASMIDRDDPEHNAHRRLVYHEFTPRAVARHEEWVRQVTTELIDAIASKGEADFIEDLAAPLPMAVIATLMGFPKERWKDLQHWCDLLICLGDGPRFVTEERFAALQQWSAYGYEFIQSRKQAPADDLVSLLIGSTIDGEALSDEWLMGEALLILTGGNETTRLSITGGLVQLSRPENRAQWDAMVGDDTRIPGAVEEMIRHTTPIHTMARNTTRDVELHGVTIPAREKVLLLYASANRDERVFADPDVFDMARDPNPHLGFGVGTHFCLGASLARMEIRVMFEELTRRLPDIRVAKGHTPEWQTTGGAFVRSMHHLPVEFTPER